VSLDFFFQRNMVPSLSRVEGFENNAKFQLTKELIKGESMRKAQMSVPWSVYPYLHAECITGLVTWKPCKYNWACTAVMGLLSCLRVLTWSAVSVRVYLGGESFGSITFWGLNSEWLSHLNYRCL
jgi:hypothetical protein